MRLGNLLKELPSHQVFGKKDIEISSITDDSRKIEKGSLFVAIRGLTFDGHKFINDVIAKGSVAIVGEEDPKKFNLNKSTYIKVDNSRACLGLLASAWNGYPAKKLKIIGVTGTDGKTTTATIIYHLLSCAGKKVGLVSTVSAKIGNKEYDTGFHVTNPEPLPLHEFLKKMVDSRCEYAVLEVTSHGLDQERVTGIHFDIGVLTNITHEHLDYHKTFESYRNAKSKLFKNIQIAILNKDDPSYSFIEKTVHKGTKVISYAIKRCDADYFAVHFDFSESGTYVTVENEKSLHLLETLLLGEYNVSNVLAAVAVTRNLHLDWEIIAKALKTFRSPAGRLENIENNKGVHIFVDFAHTPNALENVLTALKRQSKKKLIAVVGCAGERDIAKRPMMGEISTRLADYSIFTAEDPRKEDINLIIQEMVKGTIKSKAKELNLDEYNDLNSSKEHCFFRIPERGEAIAFAIQKLAKKGDIVVACGKGHEKSMCYANIEYPWSDQEAVKMALRDEVMEIKR